MLVVSSPTDAHPCCPDPDGYVAELTRRFLAAVAAGDGRTADNLAATLDAVDQAPGDLPGAAQWYVSRGWPVFPVVSGGKTPVTRHGFREASTDPDRVRGWWSRAPECNIGVPTGVRFDVIDIDYRSHPDALHIWASIKDGFEVHGIVSTPRGVHYYLTPADTGCGVAVGNRPGMDYRGRGGYVVVPPSRRPDGRYAWWSPPSPLI